MDKGKGHITEEMHDDVDDDGDDDGIPSEFTTVGVGKELGVESGGSDVEKARREEKRKRKREYGAAYRAANPEKIVAYRAENREKMAAYRAENRERIKKYKAEYQTENSARIKKYKAKYRAANSERIKKQQRAHYAAHPEHVKRSIRKQMASRYAEQTRTVEGRVEGMRVSARKRGIAFLLSAEEAQALVRKPCTYCGAAPLSGIDRIVSGPAEDKAPYSADNCVPCCTVCNRMKMVASVAEFVEHISAIYHFWVAPVDGGARSEM